jgi:hypothetical protein
VLLHPVEPIQPVHRHQPDQREIPQLPGEIRCGAAYFGAGDIATSDGGEVLWLDAGDIANVGGGAALLPGAQRVLR